MSEPSLERWPAAGPRPLGRHRARPLWPLLVVASLLLPRPVASADPLPANVFATMLKKILAYDKAISGPARIAVAYAKEYTDQAQEFSRALEGNGMTPSLVPIADMPGRQGLSAVLVLAPATPAALRAHCTRERMLSVSPLVALAERGEVSVALGVRADSKPEIVVNLRQLETEGHSFSAALLGLSRVIR